MTSSSPTSSGNRRVVILDDDPTGSQEATGVPVLLHSDRARMIEILREHHSLYLITNTRSLPEDAAIALLADIQGDLDAAERELGAQIVVVLRGDSTLRGHVFAEIDHFAGRNREPLVVFVPAYPAGGRRTIHGFHLVKVGDSLLNAADTEFARDPVFPFSSRTMVDYVREKGDREAVSTSPTEFAASAASQPAGTVIVPDAQNDQDIALIAAGIIALIDSGRDVVVRCAAPLAAFIAGVKSTGFIDKMPNHRGPVLVVVGSHTRATTLQLAQLEARWQAGVEIDTWLAITEPTATIQTAVERVAALLARAEVVTLSTGRLREDRHGGLGDGARVMSVLTAVVAAVRILPGVVVSKGGITSAEVARTGLGAHDAWVDGQVIAGVSLWHLDPNGRNLPYLVVPGNIGEPQTLRSLVQRLVDR